jgi:hypothetical protein
MRTSPKLAVAAFCVVSIGTAYAQVASPALTPVQPRSATIPSGISFNFDALHNQVSTSGLQVKPLVLTSAVTPTTGTIAVTINIAVASHFARGTVYQCSLTAIGGILDLNNGTVAGGVETAYGVAAPSGSNTATCTLTIPYAWNLPTDAAADSGLILAFGVSAVTRNDFGEVGTVQRSSLQVDGIENLPAIATTSSFAFHVTL